MCVSVSVCVCVSACANGRGRGRARVRVRAFACVCVRAFARVSTQSATVSKDTTKSKMFQPKKKAPMEKLLAENQQPARPMHNDDGHA